MKIIILNAVNDKILNNIENQEATKIQHIEEALNGNSDSKITIDDVQKAWKDILETFKARRAMVI